MITIFTGRQVPNNFPCNNIPLDTKLPAHEHGEIITGIIFGGELTLGSGNRKVLHLKAGNQIVGTVNTWYYGETDGINRLRLLSFMPIAGTLITIRQRPR